MKINLFPFWVSIIMVSMSSLFSCINPFGQTDKEPFLLAQTAIYEDDKELLQNQWSSLSKNEITEVFSLAAKQSSSDCFRYILNQGVDPLSYNSEGVLLFHIIDDRSIRKLMEAAIDELSGEELYRHFCSRIVSGIGSAGVVKRLEVSGTDYDKKISYENDEFVRTDSVRIKFTSSGQDTVQFTYQKNWLAMKGIQGGGEFSKKGKVWKLRWKGSVQG